MSVTEDSPCERPTLETFVFYDKVRIKEVGSEDAWIQSDTLEEVLD